MKTKPVEPCQDCNSHSGYEYLRYASCDGGYWVCLPCYDNAAHGLLVKVLFDETAEEEG